MSSRNVLLEGDYLPPNELSQKAINSLAAKLGSEFAGFTQCASQLQQFDTGCNKSLAKLLALNGGETKEMLTDFLFKATGLEKFVYYSASFVLLRGCWLETGESLLGHRHFSEYCASRNSYSKSHGGSFCACGF